MSSARFVSAPATVAALLVASLVGAQGRVDSAFQKFFDARSRADAEQLADEVVSSGVTFDEALRRLKIGRSYTTQAAGVIKLVSTSNGIEHHYAVNVPPDYDRSRRYQVRFQLHGGIGRRTTNQPQGTGEIGALAGAEQFYVLPYSWIDSPWWSDHEVVNLAAIVDELKRRYNIDENRVVLSGVSDGGTGAFYIGMRDTTPYASFTPLNGYIMVLGIEDIDYGQLFPDNLRNKPMFVINGGKRSAVPGGENPSDNRAHAAARGRHRLLPAAGGCPQYGVVARNERHVRKVRGRSSTGSAPRQAHLADRGPRAQPSALACHRPVRCPE